jgi:RNA polymerase sigma-70 factor (ECF subfamily)
VDQATERDLVARLRAGDESAFDAIHDAYRRRLFAFLIRLTRSRDLAEDLLEETWLRLVDRVGTLRDDSKLGPWLFTVARNLFLSRRRSRLSDMGDAGDPAEIAGLPDPGATPFDTAVANELALRIERGLAAMPVSYREVLLLVGVHGLAPSEAAAVCDLTPEALRQRLLRARRMLSWWLSGYAANQPRTAGNQSRIASGPAEHQARKPVRDWFSRSR